MHFFSTANNKIMRFKKRRRPPTHIAAFYVFLIDENKETLYSAIELGIFKSIFMKLYPIILI